MSGQKSNASWGLTLAALGVVFGDIGTSPLYALRECLVHAGYDHQVHGPEMVFGPISLMFWSLTIMVSFKYLLLLSAATAQGEGGMFALLSLLRSKPDAFKPAGYAKLVLVVLFGASLLYGDGMITPAISVLAAVEGLEELNPGLHEFVVPIAVAILLGLFMVQRYGTAKIGVAFGPITLVWFLVLGALGFYRFMAMPSMVQALSPHWGVHYLLHHGLHGVGLMGMVLLAVTGCEALYADIGHFGAKPLKRAWFILVYPALVFTYLGQGALVLSQPEALENPFFRMVPPGLLVPMIVMATLATIIASQAMITGVFSLTQQAVQLGYLPRLKIVHTNPDMRGQIYMPQVNFLLMIACIALVIGFGSSSNLAAAYGLSVSMEMLLTSILFYFVARRIWGWTLWKAILPVALFVTIEASYVAGSMTKFMQGAWFPVAVAVVIWTLMKTWTDGRTALRAATLRGRLPAEYLVEELKANRILRVPGTAVFMSASPTGLPLALLHHLKHNKCLHQQVVLMSVRFEDAPRVEAAERWEVEVFHQDFFRVVLRYGFAETANVFDDLCVALREHNEKIKVAAISFYQSRELLLTTGHAPMQQWRKGLFVFLSRLARPATGYFELPPRQVIELGIQLEL